MKRHNPTPDPFAVASDLLGGAGRWQNLGLWPAPSYDDACARLARSVGDAAALRPGDRVLEVGAGSGASLELWREVYGAEPLGLDPYPREARPDLFAGTALVGERLGVPSGHDAPFDAPFDAIVSVDAAYHFAPLAVWARAACAGLVPDGRLAFTTLAGRHPGLSQVPRGAIIPTAKVSATLLSAGLVDVRVEDLTREVLVGFADHVAVRSRTLGWRRWTKAGWPKIAATAMLARLCASTGTLAYLLISARRPSW